MLSKILKVITVGMTSMLLFACVHPGSGLRYPQVKMLQEEGFAFDDDAGWNLGLPGQILFDFGSSEVRNEIRPDIENLSINLQRYNLNQLRVIGHTDNIGTIEFNQRLSYERAEKVADVIVSKGFNKSGIDVIGRGMSQPLVENNSEENRAANRRVVIVIVP